MSNIYVLCPGNVVTGGPELLHQLVDTLNCNGKNASIVYYPFDSTFEVPDSYKHYNVNCQVFKEINFDEHAVIIPEIITGFKRYFPRSQVYIWWMSVDNYFKHFPKGLSGLKNKLLNYKKSPIKPDKLHDCTHLAQSEYARIFLSSYGLKTLMLSDYLNQEHLERDVDLSKKQNIVCYNPQKGVEVTKKLLEIFKQYKFVPIQNMTAKEVAELLERAKVYIDFGDHPGKDRIPREAAMAKCIVITGRRGSANNLIDIAVPEMYKIDEDGVDFIEAIDKVFKSVFDDFESSLLDFELYRDKIKNEKLVFQKEALEFSESVK